MAMGGLHLSEFTIEMSSKSQSMFLSWDSSIDEYSSRIFKKINANNGGEVIAPKRKHGSATLHCQFCDENLTFSETFSFVENYL